MSSSFRVRAAGLALALGLAPVAVFAQSVSLVPGLGPIQTFDSLANTGTSGALPTGWALLEEGETANADGMYVADNGSTLGGDTYSYGTTSSTDRALGGIQSVLLNPTFGARLTNNTGTVVTDIIVQYTGEEWHRGFATDDRLDFQYSLNATSLADGAWVDVDALDFVTPNKAASLGALDGNAAGNRTAIAGMISGIQLPPGATIWVRWSDLFASGGVNDGLAIDDVRFGAPDNPPFVYTTAPADVATGVAKSSNIVVTFSEPVTLGAGWYTVSCDLSGTHAATVSSGPMAWTIDPTADFTPADQCTVSIDAAQVTDQDGTPNAMAADYRFGFTVALGDSLFKDGFE